MKRLNNGNSLNMKISLLKYIMSIELRERNETCINFSKGQYKTQREIVAIEW